MDILGLVQACPRAFAAALMQTAMVCQLACCASPCCQVACWDLVIHSCCWACFAFPSCLHAADSQGPSLTAAFGGLGRGAVIPGAAVGRMPGGARTAGELLVEND